MCAGKRQGFSVRGAAGWLLECSPARALQMDLCGDDACAGAMTRWVVVARRDGKTFAVRSVRLFRGQTKWMVRGVEAWNSAGLHAVRQADVPSHGEVSDAILGWKNVMGQLLLSLEFLSKATRLNISLIRLRIRLPYFSSSSDADRLVVTCVGMPLLTKSS